MRPLFKSLRATALAAASAALTWHAAGAVVADCTYNGFQVVATTTAAQTTSSTTFQDVADAVVDIFPVPGSCVTVEISVQGRTIDPYIGRLRVVLNNEPALLPAFVSFNSTSSRFDNRRATFVLRNVPVGTNQLKLQFASAEGFNVTLSKVVMVVRYLAEG